jgi:hypothetical protein
MCGELKLVMRRGRHPIADEVSSIVITNTIDRRKAPDGTGTP